MVSLEHVGGDEAFSRLRAASQRLNLKFNVIAQEVNDTGKLREQDARCDTGYYNSESAAT